MAKASITAEEVQERIAIVHNGNVTLDVSSYVNRYSIATFVDVDYGTWQARPCSVLSGHGHPKRGHKAVANASKMRHAANKEKQTRQLMESAEVVKRLYQEKHLSCYEITKRSAELVGVVLSYAHVRLIVDELGIKRTVKEQHALSKVSERLRFEKDCEICGTKFVSSVPMGRWCDECVPKHSKHGDGARLWGGYAKKFGMSKATYDNLLKAQKNACAVCKKSFVGIEARHVHVDHSHVSGRVRGILCVYCNRGLGCFFDSAESLRNAAAYIESNTHDKQEAAQVEATAQET